MKLESLEKFQKQMMNNQEMSSLFGGRRDLGLAPGGSPTGAGEICASDYSGPTNGTCVSFTSDWEEPGHLTTLYGVSDSGKAC